MGDSASDEFGLKEDTASSSFCLPCFSEDLAPILQKLEIQSSESMQLGGCKASGFLASESEGQREEGQAMKSARESGKKLSRGRRIVHKKGIAVAVSRALRTASRKIKKSKHSSRDLKNIRDIIYRFSKLDTNERKEDSKSGY
mmetsp:Transcript_3177/g.4596  ORF Transcript_3177/g.4596 Transcript_3177/m.4596 type:complete len:143 (-) Transcript_3177:452-880(-)